jgi:hypothetical protein
MSEIRYPQTILEQQQWARISDLESRLEMNKHELTRYREAVRKFCDATKASVEEYAAIDELFALIGDE